MSTFHLVSPVLLDEMTTHLYYRTGYWPHYRKDLGVLVCFISISLGQY